MTLFTFFTLCLKWSRILECSRLEEKAVFASGVGEPQVQRQFFCLLFYASKPVLSKVLTTLIVVIAPQVLRRKRAFVFSTSWVFQMPETEYEILSEVYVLQYDMIPSHDSKDLAFRLPFPPKWASQNGLATNQPR